MDVNKFPLSKSINAHGESLSVLNLREPTGAEIIELGMPIVVTAEGSIDFKMKVVARYISRLATIPPNSVEQISPQDLMQLASEISAFFGGPESVTTPNPETLPQTS